MLFDTHSLFGYSTIASITSDTGSVLTAVVQTGDGTKFAVNQNVVLCPASTQPISSNAYVGRITAISTDTLTISYPQESSTAKTAVVGWQIFNGITPKVFTDIESLVSSDGWLTSSDTWVYATASSFTISGVDRTAIYTKGTRIKFTQTSTKYAVVISSSFSTNTTVNIAVNTDYTIANATITSPYYSYEASPQGYPGSFNLSANAILAITGGFATIVGWGSINGNSTKNITATLTFGLTFAVAPVININSIGTNSIAGTSPASFTGANNDVTNYVLYSVYASTTTQASLQAFVSSATASGTYFGYGFTVNGTI